MAISASVQFESSGPIFRQGSSRMLDEFEDRWAEKIGETGAAEIIQDGWSTYKEPTGAYASGVTHDRRVDDVVIHDSESVYGRWLEGLSSRNKTSRFKGYKLWRLKAQDLDSRSEQIGLRELPVFLARLGGD